MLIVPTLGYLEPQVKDLQRSLSTPALTGAVVPEPRAAGGACSWLLKSYRIT